MGVALIVLGLVLAFSFGAVMPGALHSGAGTGAAPASALVAPHSAASFLPASTIYPAAATPTLALTPSTGVVGITVTVNGTGFTASEAIATFHFNTTTPATQTCTAQTTNTHGNFTCTFVVPAHVPSANNVTAIGADGGADNATAVFTIPKPAIALTPSTAAPGTVVAVSGSGFTRSTAITTFTFNGATPALQSCNVQTSSAFGKFACSFVAPLGLLPGPYKVAAVGSDGVPDNATAVFTVPATGVSVAWVTGVSTYTVLPYDLAFTVSVTNANISTYSTQLWLNVSDSITGVTCVSNSLSGLVVGTSALTEPFALVVDTTYFTNVTKACPNFLSDTGTMTISATVNNATNGVASASASKTTSWVLATPTSLLMVGPTAGAPTTYTLSAVYTSQYVGKVQLSIFTPTGGLAFSTNLRWNGTTPTTAKWLEATAGLYPYTLAVFTAFGTYSSSGSIAVSGSTPVYYNSTQWVNTSFIPGLNSGEAGTILLVVGLIVGMIVALVVGRLVWGGPKPAGPAQPWSQKPAATNTCSVCGQSFTTPEELAAHSKSEHGMQ